jgi:hypothetical protein
MFGAKVAPMRTTYKVLTFIFGETEDTRMPTLTELQDRQSKVRTTGIRLGSDEVLVVDARARMSPGSFVEEKLQAALTNRQQRGIRHPK